MGYAVGFDSTWQRDIGYGVPAFCDHPGCGATIDRGLSHVCGGDAYGGERGCGLYFCGEHLLNHAKLPQLCERCSPGGRKPFPPVFEHPDWIKHKLSHESWKEWRDLNAEKVENLTRKYLG